MFYAHFVLTKKGPLARIWLAAHWDKKLTKAHVFETNIEGSVEAIIQPKAKLALRTSGHLLLGVVKIYSRKAKYLLADCNEAFVKIKMAFRPGVVDLPEENREAAFASITLPEAFHDFETLDDLTDFDIQTQFAVNQSRPEEITMREDICEDGFGDLGFNGGFMDDGLFEESMYIRCDDDFLSFKSVSKGVEMLDVMPKTPQPMSQNNKSPVYSNLQIDEGVIVSGARDESDDDDDHYGLDDDHDDDGIFGEAYNGNDVTTGCGLFEDPIDANTLTDDAPHPADQPTHINQLKLTEEPFFSSFVSPRREELIAPLTPAPFTIDTIDNMKVSSNKDEIEMPITPMVNGDIEMMPNLVGEGEAARESPTHIPQNLDAFTLKPIDINVSGHERRVRKKRRLIIDEQKSISSETMKHQLSDTSDIVASLDLAPPTKRLMLWKETGGVDKLFACPARHITVQSLTQTFTVNLIMKSVSQTSIAQETLNHLEDSSTQQPRNDSIQIKNKVGTDGQPRLVFAVKKSLLSPNTLVTPSTPLRDMPLLPSSANSPSPHQVSTLPPAIPDENFFPPSLTPLRNSLEDNMDISSPNYSQDIARPLSCTPNHVPNSPSININATSSTPSPKRHSSPPPPISSHYDEEDDDNGAYNDDYDDYDDDYSTPLVNDASQIVTSPQDDTLVDTKNSSSKDEHLNSFDEDPQPDAEEEDEGEFLEPTEGETIDALVERRWNKRCEQMLVNLNRALRTKPQVSFTETIARPGSSCKMAASKFYTLLVLKKGNAVDVQQLIPYDEIIITKAPAFDNTRFNT